MAEQTEQSGNVTISGAHAGDLVRCLGLIISNTFLYGPNHGVTKQAIKDSYEFILKVLESAPEIAFTIGEESLMVNGSQVELKNPIMKMFATHFIGMEVNGFSITKGLSFEDYLKFIIIINLKAEDLKKAGGFGAVILSENVQNIKTKSVTYVAVTEDEVVISKDEMTKAHEAEDIKGVVDYIAGGTGGDKESIAKALVAVANDAVQLGDVIMQAAEVEQKAEGHTDGNHMAMHVRDSLKKTYEILCADPVFKTQKGKKNLQKILVLIEKQLVDKLKELAHSLGEFDETMIHEMVEDISDELKIDSLAEEYMKKRNAISSNESKILRFIRTKGLDKIEETDLKERLFEGGLSAEDWRALLEKSGMAREAVDHLTQKGEAKYDGVGHLSMLLKEMQNTVKSSAVENDKGISGMDAVLSKVNEEINKLVLKTEQKILELIDDAKADVEDEKAGVVGKKPRLSRKKLFETLAEIGQELCQPLAVITCSVDLIKSGGIGPIAPTQMDMLNLVSENTVRMDVLIKRFMQISGVPEAINPDASIQTALYEGTPVKLE